MHKNACFYASLVMIRSHNQVNCNKFIFFVFGVGARHIFISFSLLLQFVSVINICMFKTITLLIIQTTNS